MLGTLREHDQENWDPTSADVTSVPSSGRPDWEKLGSKRHLVGDAQGIPSALTAATCANRHDSMAFESTLDAIHAVRGLDGRPC